MQKVFFWNVQDEIHHQRSPYVVKLEEASHEVKDKFDKAFGTAPRHALYKQSCLRRELPRAPHKVLVHGDKGGHLPMFLRGLKIGGGSFAQSWPAKRESELAITRMLKSNGESTLSWAIPEILPSPSE